MEFFTLLTVGYTVAEHQMYLTAWFDSEDACWDVLLTINGFYDKISATEGHCDVSEVASHVVRPRLRPW
tara:strand:- start:163 stop:369 length:207 start_codon:yes stop_codon:yes gene_type:complete